MPARRGRLAALVTAVLLAAPVTGVGHAAAFTPVTFHVAVGGMVDDHPQVDLQSFYPRIATVHVGDRVDFDIRGLHTVSVIPNGMPVPQPIVAAPGVYPRVDDAAGQPFWWAGSARLQFNPAVALPAGHPSVDGRHYVNSGLPTGPTFHVTVTFPRAGRYTVHCLIHPRMAGTILVEPRHVPIPSPADQVRIGHAQAALDTARALARDDVLTQRAQHLRHTVIVGAGTTRYSLMAFYPRRLTVHTGQRVTFRLSGINEIHTVTFGPQPYLDAIEARLFPPPPPPMITDPVGALPSQPPASPVELTPTLHGNGFLNSGILTDPGTPGTHRFTVRFGMPGAYHLDCLIHDGMDATIDVVP